MEVKIAAISSSLKVAYCFEGLEGEREIGGIEVVKVFL